MEGLWQPGFPTFHVVFGHPPKASPFQAVPSINSHHLRFSDYRRLSDYPEETSTIYPRCSMYGIFTYIWVIFEVNVGKYSIHGSYGVYLWTIQAPFFANR